MTPRCTCSPAAFVALLLATAWAGCSASSTGITALSLVRPTGVSFVCFDMIEGAARDLQGCADEKGNQELVALVLETSTGQLGQVNLTTNRILDTDQRIPGFTFKDVGADPVVAHVPPLSPRFVYVATRANPSVLAVPLNGFHPELDPGDALEQTVPLPGAPVDMVLASDGAALWVTLGTLGQLARIPLNADGTLGAVQTLSLSASTATPSDASPENTYCKSCTLEQFTCSRWSDLRPVDSNGDPKAMAARDPVNLGVAATPGAIATAPDSNTVWIADTQLPIVHVIDGDSFTETAQLNPGVPLWDLVASPEVPETTTDQAADPQTTRVRFLYGISATDRTVLAMDASDGSVQPVRYLPGRPQDRMSPVAATGLSMILPGFDVADVCDPTDTERVGEAASGRLRGAFLTVATLGGVVHFVDVYDQDATCRGGDIMCVDDPATGVSDLFIQRHRPRISSSVVSVALQRNPAVSINGASSTYTIDGTTPSVLAPSLSPLPAVGEMPCPERMDTMFPSEGDPMICAFADPWDGTTQAWFATYEGTLPSSNSALGQLENGADGPALTLSQNLFCNVGVLGRENVDGLTGPESGYAGDLLVVTSELDFDAGTACEERFLDRDGNLKLIDIPIVRSESQRLLLAQSARSGVSFADVLGCFNGRISFEVRSQGAYTVVGSASGFVHRVSKDAQGLCIVNENDGVTGDSRARHGQVLDNGLIRFQLAQPQPVDENGDVFEYPTREEEVELSFAVVGFPSKLRIDTGNLPVAVEYNRGDGRMYAVDESAGALHRISTEAVSIVRTFR